MPLLLSLIASLALSAFAGAAHRGQPGRRALPPALRQAAGKAAPAARALPDSESAATPEAAASPEASVDLAPAAAVETPQAPDAAHAPEAVAALAASVAEDIAALEDAPHEQSSAVAERQAARLAGERRAAATAADVAGPVAAPDAEPALLAAPEPSGAFDAEPARVPAPAPVATLAPEAKKNVRRMLAGLVPFKFGVEAVNVAVSQIALASLGSAFAMALVIIVNGLAQSVIGGLAGSLSERFRASRVLAAAVVVQGIVVLASFILIAAGGVPSATAWFKPWMLFPMAGLIGAAAGIGEAARRVIGPRLVGKENERELERYNGKEHVFFEAGGVAGSLLAGFMILAWGNPSAALVLQPAAFVLAALLFWRVVHGQPEREAARARAGVARRLAGWWGQFKLAAKAIFGHPVLKWAAFAAIAGLLTHRVFESLVIPIFTKKVLGDPAATGWLNGASNGGELLGGLLLMALAARGPGLSRVVTFGAVGFLAVWAAPASALWLPSWLLLAVPVLLSSLAWAWSDKKLMSAMQRHIPTHLEAKAHSVMLAISTGIVTLAWFGLGRFFDAVAPITALLAVGGLFSALAALVFWFSRRLRP